MSTLAEQLEADLNWREAELGTFKTLICKASQGSAEHTALLRAIWALLYAHYEGFCKFSWDIYLEEMENSRVKRNVCEESIAKLSLNKDFSEFKKGLSNPEIWVFCKSDFRRLLEKPLSFEFKLETNSNLWPKIVRENCQAAGLPHSQLDTHEIKLRALVSRRNVNSGDTIFIYIIFYNSKYIYRNKEGPRLLIIPGTSYLIHYMKGSSPGLCHV